MGIVDCGGVDYTSYCGDITIRRKGGELKFGQAKNYDEEFALKAKQGLQDNDRIITGKKSFITIMGNPKDNRMQSVSAYPESEFVMGMGGWEATVDGERRKGVEISRLELLKGAFSLYPASAEVDMPMVKVEDRNAKKGVSFHYIVDILPDMVVVLPGCKLLVSSGGKEYETSPWFGMIGMTELIATRSGMFEKKTKVDERATRLCEYAGFTLAPGGMVSGSESMMEYSARKNEEGKAKTAEYMEQAPSGADIERMGKEGKLSPAQLEMARASSKAMKESGGSGPAYAMNLFANMDFSKLKGMPGLTPEQRKQLEEGMPQMVEMQRKMAEGGAAKLTARMRLSEKYVAATAGDPIIKKRMAQVQTGLAAKLDAYALPPYPVPKEWARVK